jgi:hypothetical protein
VGLQTERLPGPRHRILRNTQMRGQVRVQCVTFFDVLSKVVITIFSTCSSVTVRALPAASRPASPHAVARRTGCATWSPPGARPLAVRRSHSSQPRPQRRARSASESQPLRGVAPGAPTPPSVRVPVSQLVSTAVRVGITHSDRNRKD